MYPTNIFEFGSGVQVNYMEKFNPVGSCFQFHEVGLEKQVVSGYCALLLRQTTTDHFRDPISYEVFYSVWNRTCYPLDEHLVCYPLDEHLPTLAPESISSNSFGFSLCLHGVLKCMCESVLNDMLQGVLSLLKSYLTSYSSVKASHLGLLRCPALSPPLRKAYKPLLGPHSLNKAWKFSPGSKRRPQQNWPHLFAISQESLFSIAW